MLLSSKRIICILITLLLLTTSCSIEGSNKNREIEPTIGNEGTIAMQLPTFMSFIDYAKPEKTGSRAILSSDKIQVKVFQDGNYLKTVTTKNQKDIYATSFHNNSYFAFSLPQGKYSIEVEVFNPHQEDTPVVKGASEEFEVKSMETVDVELVLAPVTTENIELSKVFTINKSDYIATTLDENLMINTGSEKWYNFTATSELTKIDISSNNEDMSFFVILFDKFGNSRMIYKDHVFSTTPDETYYLATAYVEFPEDFWDLPVDRDLSSKTFTITPFVNVEDANNSLETAEEVKVGERKILELDKENDQDFFKVELTAGSEYIISFNFEEETPDKVTFYKNGEVYTNIDQSLDGLYTYNYTPLEDETIYISVNLDFGFYDQYLTPSLSVIDFSNPSIYLFSWDGSYFEVGNSVEAIVINNEDQTTNSIIFPIESNDAHGFNRTLDSVKLMDNVSLIFLLKDSEGNAIGVSEKFDLREQTDFFLFLNFYSDYITIDEEYGSKRPEITGVEATTFLKISEYIYSDVLEVKNGDLTVKATVTLAPEGSQLLNSEITVEYNELEEVYHLSFATDVSGDYEILIEASNAYTTSNLGLVFSTKKENEGVLNVTFE